MRRRVLPLLLLVIGVLLVAGAGYVVLRSAESHDPARAGTTIEDASTVESDEETDTATMTRQRRRVAAEAEPTPAPATVAGLRVGSESALVLQGPPPPRKPAVRRTLRVTLPADAPENLNVHVVRRVGSSPWRTDQDVLVLRARAGVVEIPWPDAQDILVTTIDGIWQGRLPRSDTVVEAIEGDSSDAAESTDAPDPTVTADSVAALTPLLLQLTRHDMHVVRLHLESRPGVALANTEITVRSLDSTGLIRARAWTSTDGHANVVLPEGSHRIAIGTSRVVTIDVPSRVVPTIRLRDAPDPAPVGDDR